MQVDFMLSGYNLKLVIMFAYFQPSYINPLLAELFTTSSVKYNIILYLGFTNCLSTQIRGSDSVLGITCMQSSSGSLSLNQPFSCLSFQWRVFSAAHIHRMAPCSCGSRKSKSKFIDLFLLTELYSALVLFCTCVQTLVEDMQILY